MTTKAVERVSECVGAEIEEVAQRERKAARGKTKPVGLRLVNSSSELSSLKPKLMRKGGLCGIKDQPLMLEPSRLRRCLVTPRRGLPGPWLCDK